MKQSRQSWSTEGTDCSSWFSSLSPVVFSELAAFEMVTTVLFSALSLLVNPLWKPFYETAFQTYPEVYFTHLLVSSQSKGVVSQD